MKESVSSGGSNFSVDTMGFFIVLGPLEIHRSNQAFLFQQNLFSEKFTLGSRNRFWQDQLQLQIIILRKVEDCLCIYAFSF